jgi:hypothetical protein
MSGPRKGSSQGECFTAGCTNPARWIALGEAPRADIPQARYRCPDCCDLINDIWTADHDEAELLAALGAELPELRGRAMRKGKG